jgi:hypothetical protein
MTCNKLSFLRVAICLAVSGAVSVTRADVIHETHDPFGGPFGITGFDVFVGQSVAARFTPGGNYTLDRVRLWLWNNDENGREPPLTIKVETDDPAEGESRPSGTVLETWNINLPNTGAFNPMLLTFESSAHAALDVNMRYWITARSPAQGGSDPVWAWAALDSGPMSLIDHVSSPEWSNASDGAVAAFVVEGTLARPHGGDVDGDGDVDLTDLALLLSSFGLCEGDPGFNPDANFDDDMCVTLNDLTFLLSNYGL